MPYLLVILGLLLIWIEFYLPGIIMGILGGISILIGILLFASHTQSWIAVLLFIIGTLVGVVLTIRFAIWRIVHAKPEHSIYSNKSQEGFQASTYDKTTIGKLGIVLSDLKPGGYILIEGHQYPAVSISGYITKGETVTVISGQEHNLLVQSIKKEKNP